MKIGVELFPDKEYDEEQKKIAFSFQDSDYEDKENTIQELWMNLK
ncbi:MAG: hypothetical protein ACLUD0_03345 [Eubacterium ramulus]